jgi:hypothetical protein
MAKNAAKPAFKGVKKGEDTLPLAVAVNPSKNTKKSVDRNIVVYLLCSPSL